MTIVILEKSKIWLIDIFCESKLKNVIYYIQIGNSERI
jgi:hypothetical protein